MPYPELEPGMPPSSTPSQGFDTAGPDWSGALMSLGTALGGVAQIQSGGRLPNAAAQIQQMYQQRQQHDIENKIRSAALQMQQQKAQQDAEKFKVDRLTNSWKMVQDVREALGDLEPEKADRYGAKIATEYAGDPELADIFSKSLQNDGTRKTVEQLFGRVVKDKGIDTATRLFKDPQFKAQLPKMEAALQRDETVKSLTDLVQRGVISKDASMADIAKVVPGFSVLEDKDMLMLNQMGMKNVKSKGVAEAEAKAQIETAGQRAAAERQDKQLEYRQQRDEIRDAQWNATYNRLLDQNKNMVEIMRQRNERLPTDQIRMLANFKEGEQVLQDLKRTHAKVFSQGSPISEAFKGALLTSDKARTLREAMLPDDAAQTDAEREYAAAYNTTIASLYKLTDERQLSEQEGLRNLRSFNPVVSGKQGQANIDSRIKSLQRQRMNFAESFNQGGRTVPETLRPNEGVPAQPTSGNRPRATNPKTGEVVEWDGKQWVGVK